MKLAGWIFIVWATAIVAYGITKADEPFAGTALNFAFAGVVAVIGLALVLGARHRSA